MILQFVSSPVTSRSYLFETPGVYLLQCLKNCTVLANITVLEREGANYTSPVQSTCIPQRQLSELIYSHAGIMAFTFGILLPLGALLANCKLHIPHMVVQPLGLLLAIVGLSLAVAFKIVNNQGHFQNLHSILGLVLLLLAILIQPALRLIILAPLKRQWEFRFTIWHKRLGTAIVFFGMSNVFLVREALKIF